MSIPKKAKCLAENHKFLVIKYCVLSEKENKV